VCAPRGQDTQRTAVVWTDTGKLYAGAQLTDEIMDLMIEKGTYRTAAKPFMRPTHQQDADRAVVAVGASLRREILGSI